MFFIISAFCTLQICLFIFGIIFFMRLLFPRYPLLIRKARCSPLVRKKTRFFRIIIANGYFSFFKVSICPNFLLSIVAHFACVPVFRTALGEFCLLFFNMTMNAGNHILPSRWGCNGSWSL